MNIQKILRKAAKPLAGLALITALNFTSCEKENNSSTTGPSGGKSEETTRINIHTYWNDGDPAFVNVYVYKAYSDKRFEAGSTNSQGNFYSSLTYPTDDLYEIFIQDIPSRQCLDNVLVGFNSNTPWPVIKGREISKKINVGDKNPKRDLSGCRF